MKITNVVWTSFQIFCNSTTGWAWICISVSEDWDSQRYLSDSCCHSMLFYVTKPWNHQATVKCYICSLHKKSTMSSSNAIDTCNQIVLRRVIRVNLKTWWQHIGKKRSYGGHLNREDWNAAGLVRMTLNKHSRLIKRRGGGGGREGGRGPDTNLFLLS